MMKKKRSMSHRQYSVLLSRPLIRQRRKAELKYPQLKMRQQPQLYRVGCTKSSVNTDIQGDAVQLSSNTFAIKVIHRAASDRAIMHLSIRYPAPSALQLNRSDSYLSRSLFFAGHSQLSAVQRDLTHRQTDTRTPAFSSVRR